jgi:hypothetical protein
VTEKRPSFEWALLFAKLLCENTDLWVQRSSKSISSKIQLTSGGLLDEVPQIQIASLRRLFNFKAAIRGLFISGSGNHHRHDFLLNRPEGLNQLHTE